MGKAAFSGLEISNYDNIEHVKIILRSVSSFVCLLPAAALRNAGIMAGYPHSQRIRCFYPS